MHIKFVNIGNVKNIIICKIDVINKNQRTNEPYRTDRIKFIDQTQSYCPMNLIYILSYSRTNSNTTICYCCF